ncbi:MAG: cyclic pyranopterin monophosphate synthase MoaC [Candidatus Methylomirabilales bacterium]
MPEQPLSHLTPEGTARMVDVSSKQPTPREARAAAFVRISEATLAALQRGGLAKGDALGVARIAGIMAAKRTDELIPLCHPLALTNAEVDLQIVEGGVSITSAVKTHERTGVEMEALVAASVAALTLYDMCKAVDKAISIERIELVSKSGGKSGLWIRPGG